VTEESIESSQHYAEADEETAKEFRPPVPVLRQSTVADALSNPRERKRLRMPEGENDPGPVVVELNLLHEGALAGAAKRFKMLCQQVLPEDRRKPQLIANTYFRCDLSMNEIRELVRLDQAGVEAKTRSIYRIWPDFPVYPLIDRSVSTVKADAARRSYEASGEGITWAVVDSGINRRHPHFGIYRTLDDDVAKLHKNFSDSRGALVDGYGHGTHVAGIIAGGLPAKPEFRVCVGQRVADDLLGERIEERTVTEPERLSGVAPRCKLVSVRVLDDYGNCRSTGVISALQYIREQLNGNGKLLQVHGINLSLGYEFDAKWFACGQSPVCVEVDRLVRSGVVVVIAAGNTGYGDLTSSEGLTGAGLSLTINDPGNASLGITVGATHRDSPHTYGVSYFSSKGPTGDGRLKPDLVAPGERITSCAAGHKLTELKSLWGSDPPLTTAAYIDDSGTSMAAPHVSGVIASFLSIRREFIGRPEEVKRIFLETATSLGRERYFEGAGLVDLMRAIQSV